MNTDDINELALSISDLREDNKSLNEDDFYDVVQKYLLISLNHLNRHYLNIANKLFAYFS